MVYIDRDGSVVNTKPWTLRRATETFWSFFSVVTMFFQTLISPLQSALGGSEDSTSGSGGSGSRWFSSGGGGSGSGSGYGGGNGRSPPRFPQTRRIGRINTAPSCSSGGCCGS